MIAAATLVAADLLAAAIVPAAFTSADSADSDLERRFGGLRRLYGEQGYRRLRAASVAVVGLGGVGSWAAEALVRCGVARLVLFDLDHISASNINRQVQASGATLGAHKGQALRERFADIHPGCDVHVVDAFVEPGNWPALLTVPVDVLIDACDQARAKLTLASWARQANVALVCVGAAGGKRQAQCVEVADLAEVTHDPLLAGLRQRLRKETGAPRSGEMGLRCVFSREPVQAPLQVIGTEASTEASADGSRTCHGDGSTVTVTATVGMGAAGEAIQQLLAARPG